MRIQLPRALARFNRMVTNPVQGVYAGRLPPWAVIVHPGRRTGRMYRTPVLAFRRGRVLAVVVLYGERSDWVRNLLAAGGGSVVRRGLTFRLTEVRVVDVLGAVSEGREEGAEVSRVARVIARRTSGRLLVGVLGPPSG